MSELKNEEIPAVSDPEGLETDLQEPELTAGARLARAREAKQLDLRDVAEKTRQSQDTLAALEAMETDHIPASILRLQAKNYARFLGLPENEIATAFAPAPGSTNVDAMPVEAPTSPHSRRAVLIGGGAVLAAVTLIGGLSLILSAPAPDATDPLAISARLAPAYADVTEIEGLTAATTAPFSIQANKRAWIEVRGSDGTVFRNREMSAGETYFPRLEAGWTITVRDGGAFEWRLGDTTFEPVGEEAQALYSISVDAAHAAALTAQSAALAEVSNTSERPR